MGVVELKCIVQLQRDELEMAVAWNRDEVLKLIELWGDGAIQAQLEGCKRNQEIYDKIAADLREAGFERTGKQCRDKIKKLKGEYRKIKDKRNKTGEGRFPEWDYFDPMDEILGHRPATQPPIVVNSLEELAGETTGNSANEPTGDTAGDTAGESQADDRGNSSEPELEDIQHRGSSSSTKDDSRSTTPLALQQRKRKRSKGDKNDASTTELMSKLLKVQEESDKRLIQLEEKRLEFEERQMEKEAQQRKEEREFQLKMMQLMMSQRYAQPQSHYHPPVPFDEVQGAHDHMYTFSPSPDNND